MTTLPAAGFALEEVTRYLVAVPGTVVIVPVVPVKALPSVPVIVVAIPEIVSVVKATVAIPPAFVAELADAKVPSPLDLDQVTVRPAVATALLFASAS